MSQKTRSNRRQPKDKTKKNKLPEELGNNEYSLKGESTKNDKLNLSSMFHLKDYERFAVKNDIYYILKHSDIKCSFSIEFIKPISENLTDLEKELEYYSTPTVYYKQKDVNDKIENNNKPKNDNLSFFELPKSEIIKERFDEKIIKEKNTKYNKSDFDQKIKNAKDHMPVYINTITRILATEEKRRPLHKLFGFSIEPNLTIDQIKEIPFSIQYEIVNRIPNYKNLITLNIKDFFEINVYYFIEKEKTIRYIPLSKEKYDKMIELLKNQNNITFKELYDKLKTTKKLTRADFSFKNVTE
jgi:hypothetical protein